MEVWGGPNFSRCTHWAALEVVIVIVLPFFIDVRLMPNRRATKGIDTSNNLLWPSVFYYKTIQTSAIS
jgi:hypothetical protein